MKLRRRCWRSRWPSASRTTAGKNILFLNFEGLNIRSHE
jgi:hypothetical protein